MKQRVNLNHAAKNRNQKLDSVSVNSKCNGDF